MTYNTNFIYEGKFTKFKFRLFLEPENESELLGVSLDLPTCVRSTGWPNKYNYVCSEGQPLLADLGPFPKRLHGS